MPIHGILPQQQQQQQPSQTQMVPPQSQMAAPQQSSTVSNASQYTSVQHPQGFVAYGPPSQGNFFLYLIIKKLLLNTNLIL